MLIQKQLPFLYVILICMLLFFSACGTKADDKATADAAGTETETVGYSTIDVFGTVIPRCVYSVNFGFNCKINGIYIRDGEIVNKNDRILELDLDGIRFEISSKEQLYRQCLIDLELLKDEYEKNIELMKEKTISRNDLKKSEADYQKKKSELAMLEQDYDLTKKLVESDYLSGNTLVCPIDHAVISGFRSEEGNFIGKNTLILKLIDLNSIVVEANVPEEFISDVRSGAQAEVIPLASRQSSYSGTVTFIAHGAKKENGETIVPVEITLEDKVESLLPYFNVDIKIRKDKSQGGK